MEGSVVAEPGVEVGARRICRPVTYATATFASEASAALFQVITQRYLKSSTVLTTNLGIASWGQVFDDPTAAVAMLDRLLHRSVVFNINGDSYRMRAHRARTENLRKAINPTTNTSATTHPADHWGTSMIDTGENSRSMAPMLLGGGTSLFRPGTR